MKTKLILVGLLALCINSYSQDPHPGEEAHACSSQGPELIVNGDFNSGYVGFTSWYTNTIPCAPGGILGDGTANTFNINLSNSCYSILDHNSANGMVAHFPDIQGVNTGINFWEQTVSVSQAATYKLSFWVYEPLGNQPVSATGTNFDVYINSVLIDATNVGVCGSWVNKLYTWHSGPNLTANIRIKNGSGNLNVGTTGMDLLLDDVSFKQCIQATPCKKPMHDLIINGDFSSGIVGFTNGFAYTMGCAGGGILGNGTANTFNRNLLFSCYGVNDHNNIDGYALHFPDIQGANVGQVFWEHAPIPVTVAQTYVLSFWVYEPSGNSGVQPAGTYFDVYINNTLLQMEVVGGYGSWYNKVYSWTATNPIAVIKIQNGAYSNTNVGITGMDLILDDISFGPCFSVGNPERSQEYVGIKESVISNQALSVMPNPSNGNTILKSSLDLRVRISNELGQIIREFTLEDSNEHTLLLNNLSEGIYFINGSSGDNLIQKKLIITNH